MWCLLKIPKIIHLYWGNESISYLRYLTAASFLKLNPDWEVRLYLPSNPYKGPVTWPTHEHRIPFTGKNYMDALLALPRIKIKKVNRGFINVPDNIPEIFRSDLIRLFLLRMFGGLWSDFDVLYFKPMNDLYFNNDNNKNKDSFICYTKYYSIGFMMASGQSEFFSVLLHKALDYFNVKDYQSIGSHLYKKVFPDTSHIKDDFLNMKMETVYPIISNVCDKIFEGDYMNMIKEGTIGVHWYAGAQIAKKYENEITHENIHKYNNVIGQLIKGVKL